jgi:AhpD family alkylhydroperoxidase
MTATGETESPDVARIARSDEPGPAETCRVRMLDADDATFSRVREVYRIEQANQGRVRHMTRATAGSAAAWQAATKALQIYGSLRRLDRKLVDLVCLYTSLLNGCVYCIDDAAGEARNSGWETGDLLALGGGHESAYPPAVVVALRYAAVVARDPHGADDVLIDEVRSCFGGDEGLLELTAVLAMKNFWNRFATALRIPAEGKCTDLALMAELLALSRALRPERGAGCSTESDG